MLAVWFALGVVALAIILENLALILAFVLMGIVVVGIGVALWFLIRDHL